MRLTHQPTTSSVDGFRNALHGDLGIYHLQSGSGIGSFFGNLLKTFIPIGKSLVKKGLNAALPELEKLAQRGIKYTANKATSEVQSRVENYKKRGSFKRKKDELS